MAYVSQQMKEEKAPAIKAICKKYGVRATIAVKHHSTMVLNIWEGNIDFLTHYNKMVDKSNRQHGFYDAPPANDKHVNVNIYHIDSWFDGQAKKFLNQVVCEMNKGNHDNSDIMTDYFDVGFYIDVNIGKYDKPYILRN